MASAAATGQPTRERATPLLDVDIDGGLVRLRAPYDPDLVEEIRRLPGRRFIAERAEWVLPARRAGLIALARLLTAVDARLSERARRRLERHGPGRLELSEGEFELRASPRPHRLERIRAIPERRYLPKREAWRIRPTRAGALALLALLEAGELVCRPEVEGRVRQVAAGRPGEGESRGGGGGEPSIGRASPTPHWRHVTRGPIFRANTQRREWIDGIGWCVRVRVDSRRRSGAK
jgi:hypothetical protein